MFVSYQNFFAVPLVVYEHVYEVSSLYYIGKLGFQNPCFSTDSREIEYIYIYRVYIYRRRFRMQIEGRVFSQTIQDTDFPDPTS